MFLLPQCQDLVMARSQYCQDINGGNANRGTGESRWSDRVQSRCFKTSSTVMESITAISLASIWLFTISTGWDATAGRFVVQLLEPLFFALQWESPLSDDD